MIEVNRISIKKLDAYKENNPPLDKDKPVNVNITISLIDHKIEDNYVVFKSSFALDMSDIGHIDAQVDVFVTTDDRNKLLSEWNNENSLKLPKELRVKIDNAIYLYIMPLIINITEKMQMPVPISPLSMKN
jgi:hypothetical protein